MISRRSQLGQLRGREVRTVRPQLSESQARLSALRPITRRIRTPARRPLESAAEGWRNRRKRGQVDACGPFTRRGVEREAFGSVTNVLFPSAQCEDRRAASRAGFRRDADAVRDIRSRIALHTAVVVTVTFRCSESNNSNRIFPGKKAATACFFGYYACKNSCLRARGRMCLTGRREISPHNTSCSNMAHAHVVNRLIRIAC